MKAIILAGGKGTRLQSVVSSVPKPMAPVGGRPFLEYLILQLKFWDTTNIVLSVGYKREAIKSYFTDGKPWGVSIAYSEEDVPLGTGGAAKKAFQCIPDETAIVMNGDSYFDADIKRLASCHNEHHACATIALCPMKNTGRYGRVAVMDSGSVVAFDEKKEGTDGLINAGLYVINKEVLSRYGDEAFSIEREVFPSLIGKGFVASVHQGFFIDIGIPDDYSRICNNPALLMKHGSTL